VEEGKVRGLRWTLVVDMGMVEVSNHRLVGARGVIVTVDLTDMSKFIFPGTTRNGAIRSEWIKGGLLANWRILGP
jgi:hypothetical protein